MLSGRRRRRESLNVFIAFTDLLFVTVFILVLQVLAQGMAARSEAQASIVKQHKALAKALYELKNERADWAASIRSPKQHESLQRIIFTDTMTFKPNSANIDDLPADASLRDRSEMLLALARHLSNTLPSNATVEIQGFWGAGDRSADVALDRAQAVMKIFAKAGIPTHRLAATAYSGRIPRSWGYDDHSPASRPDYNSGHNRRIEILILARNTKK